MSYTGYIRGLSPNSPYEQDLKTKGTPICIVKHFIF